MLTNSNQTRITIDSLRNKVFYLDTNIIFRALGINGSLRKSRTLSILQKFQQVGEVLKISRVTADEFKNSIEHHVKVLEKYDNPNIHAGLFLEVNGGNKEFYCFYQQWKRDKVNMSLDMFKAHVKTLYDGFLKQFNVEVETFSPYDRTTKEHNDKLSGYTEGILTYKRNQFEAKSRHDAENIIWIEHKRKISPQSIYEAKYFLLSSDQRLQKWDYSRAEQVPIVFLPSQWLSISLRFLERTNDDFSSFVSFLNLPYHETLLDNDKMLAVLSGISEYATSYQNQKQIYNQFVEERTIRAINEWSLNVDTLYDEAKDFAKSEVEKKLEAAEQELHNERTKSSTIIKNQKDELDAHRTDFDNLQNRVHILEAENDSKTAKLNELEKQNACLVRKENIRKKWWSLLLYTFFILMMIVLVLLTFFLQDWEYNYISTIVNIVESYEETRKTIGIGVITVVYGYFFQLVVKRLWNCIKTLKQLHKNKG